MFTFESVHIKVLFIYNSHLNSHFLLTYSPAKNQPFALIRKFNFEIISISVSKLWCLKCIDISLTLIRTLLWAPGGPKVPKMEKLLTLYWNGIRWNSTSSFCPLTPLSWNWPVFPYSWENWEFLSNSFFRNF